MLDSFNDHLKKIAYWGWEALGVNEIRVSLCDKLPYRNLKYVFRHQVGILREHEGTGVGNTANAAFLLLRDTDYIYLGSDQKQAITASEFSGNQDSKYKSGMVCTISHGGGPVGLIEVYSIIENAFCRDHLESLQILARTIAISYVDNDLRSAKTQRTVSYDDILKLVQTSPLYSSYKQDIKFIIYDIDYTTGKLVCHYNTKESSFDHDALANGFSFAFRDQALATYIFENGETVLGVKKGTKIVAGEVVIPMDTRGINAFKIPDGAIVYATTIRAKGQILQILVGWHSCPKNMRNYRTIFERIKRIVRLVKNDDTTHDPKKGVGGRANSFIVNLGKKLQVKKWQDKSINESHDFLKQELQTLLKTTIDEGGFHKVRVWILKPIQVDNYSPTESILIASRVSSQARFISPDGVNLLPEIDGYTTLQPQPTQEIYTQYTLARYRRDPWARWQEMTMYNEEDSLQPILNKASGGKWVTVPLIWNHKNQRILIGYLSADCHIRANNMDNTATDKTESEMMDFQRCALDLIGHIAVRCIVPIFFDQLFQDRISE